MANHTNEALRELLTAHYLAVINHNVNRHSLKRGNDAEQRLEAVERDIEAFIGTIGQVIEVGTVEVTGRLHNVVWSNGVLADGYHKLHVKLK